MYQCYYYETGYVYGRAYKGKKILTERFSNEREAEDYCDRQSNDEISMLYEEE